MNGMFNYASSLTSIDLSGWNTGNLTDMSYMFSYAEALTALDLSGWNTGSVTNVSSMFAGVFALNVVALGPNTILNGGTGLTDAVTNPYTGRWVSVGAGSVSSPRGTTVAANAAALLSGSRTVNTTYVRQQAFDLMLHPNNGPQPSTSIAVPVVTGVQYQLPSNAFTYADHDFSGWNTVPDGSGQTIADGAKLWPDSDVRYLVGQWRTAPTPTPTPAPEKPVVKTIKNATAPKISGTAKVGKKLAVKTGKWSVSGVKFTYQWRANGKAISKATKSTYTIPAAHVGKKITVKVTAKKSGYTSASKTSGSTKKVAKSKATVTGKLSSKNIKKSKSTKVTLTVKVPGVAKPAGTVTVKVGSKTFKTTLKASNKGKIKVTLKGKSLKVAKKQKVTATFTPNKATGKAVLKSKAVSLGKLTVKK